MWKYSALISYVGTSFCGWQKQLRPTEKQASRDKPSVQSVIEKSLSQITEEEVTVVGSGRTDSGVHAVGQVIHFVLRKKEWSTEILNRGLNSLLPMSIQVLSVKPVAIEFHAQRSAVRKQYSYYFQQGSCALPHLEPLSWWIRKKLDLEAMSEALQQLVGEHDFKPFQASGSKPGSTVRQILEADVTRVAVGFPLGILGPTEIETRGMSLVRVRVMGTGFLKQMVRGIAGTLLQVGESRRPSSCMKEILTQQDRSLVGPTAPARALWLERVWYPAGFQLWDPASDSHDRDQSE
jgi:tRNA pseudouridine38-40 synthase